MLLIILIIINSFIILITNKNEIFDTLPIKYLIVKSNSMKPVLFLDDIIIIKREEQYEIGDIITYKQNDNFLITHRIIKKTDNFITKGDNNNSPDKNCVNFESIEGKVIFIINKNRKYIFIFTIFFIVTMIFLWKGIRKWKS